jgi:hypothetical protein
LENEEAAVLVVVAEEYAHGGKTREEEIQVASRLNMSLAPVLTV